MKRHGLFSLSPVMVTFYYQICILFIRICTCISNMSSISIDILYYLTCNL